jgi:hypothetical protein
VSSPTRSQGTRSESPETPPSSAGFAGGPLGTSESSCLAHQSWWFRMGEPAPGRPAGRKATQPLRADEVSRKTRPMKRPVRGRQNGHLGTLAVMTDVGVPTGFWKARAPDEARSCELGRSGARFARAERERGWRSRS